MPTTPSSTPLVVESCAGTEQEYSYGADSPAIVAAQQLYAVSSSRPLTVTGIVGSLAKGADEGNQGPEGLHSDSNEHWNAYPWTGRALPPDAVGATAATSNDPDVGFETVTSVGGFGRVGTTSVESPAVHCAFPSKKAITKHSYAVFGIKPSTTVPVVNTSSPSTNG